MPPIIEMKYGHNRCLLQVPEDAAVLTVRDPQRRVSRDGFAADLNAFLARRPVRGGRVAVALADKTRLCEYGRYLPVLLACLEKAGLKPCDMTLFIAYGTHPTQSDAESRTAYGDLFSRWRWVHHDCDDATLFKGLGQTRRGTPIRIRRDILAADRLITFGAISHHYFAGFGGGRKLVFPGLGHREAIYRNHALFLDAGRRTLSGGCRPGKLDGNPLAEDLAEIETHCPADLAVHGILDSRGRVCRLMVGQGRDHFRKACSEHDRNCSVLEPDRYDMVVASCGGAPKDINFIQAHKALHNAAAFVGDGGLLILFAQCPDGIGSKTFLPWFAMGGPEAAFDHLSRAYEGNGGTALSMMEKCRRIRIRLITDLPPDLCRIVGAPRLDQNAAQKAIAGHPGSMAVIPNASLLVKRQ
ncbi:MAG: lactate racemase domain-containing protein [Desulfosarcina sp.]